MRFATWGLAVFVATAAADVIPVIGTQDAVSIPVPAGAGADDALLIELDGYDISALSEVANGRIGIPLRSLALAPGQHYLLIQAQTPDGDIDTLAEHVFDVYAREGVRQSSRHVNLLLGSAYRIAESAEEDFAGAPRSHQTAALQWSGEADRSQWTASGSADVLFDSDRTSSFDGERWQLPSIDLRVGRRFTQGAVALGFGDTAAAESNLIFGGFNRRGLRFEAEAFERRITAQAFTLHANPVTQLNADVPPFDDNSSVVGALAAFSPLPKHPEVLRLSASWLEGDATLGGAGVFVAGDGSDEELAVGGDAYNLALDSLPFGGAIWLRGEYAHSRFDADGLRVGAAERPDDARRFVAQLGSNGDWRLPLLEQWSLGFERQRVGAHFYSLANLMLPNDLDYRQVHAAVAAKGLSISARWLDQHTDVDDEPLTPRVDSRQRALALEFTPRIADASTGLWKWLGMPTFRASRETTGNSLLEADVPLAAFDLDNEQRSVSLGVDLAHERFTLGLTLDRVRRDDRSQPFVVDDFPLYEPAPDSREKLWGASFSWYVNERFTLAPQWQRSRLRESQGGTFDNDLWSLQIQAELIPGALSAQFGWSEASDDQRFFELPQDAQRQTSSAGNLDLSWNMKWITFHLQGAYGRNVLRTPMFQESGNQWQAQLRADLNWEHSR